MPLTLPAVAAAAAGFTSLLTGPTANGTFELSAQKQQSAGLKGVCLDLSATFADGTSPGSGGGCAFGSLKAGGNILPVSTSSGSGDTKTSSLVGGLVVSRARTVRVRFADGKTLKVTTKAPPKAFRRLLGTRVRAFAGDALAVTSARVSSVSGYDARGRRVARAKPKG
jgi:hypothetical protein